MIPLIKTDRGYVAVSDEPIKKSNWCVSFSTINQIPQLDSGKITKAKYEYAANPDLQKIILTDNTFKLEGVNQFKLEDEELENYKKFLSIFSDVVINVVTDIENLPKGDEYDRLVLNLIKDRGGISPFQSKGCYSEEQMKQFAKIVSEEHLFQHTESYRNRRMVELLNYLNQPKQLIGIDTEIKCIEQGIRDGYPSFEDCEYPNCSCTPKVTDGFVTVTKYYYQ